MPSDFNPTLNIEDRIAFDDESRRLRLGHSGNIYPYSALRGYELLEETGYGRGMERAYSLSLFGFGGNVRNVRSMKVRLIFEGAEEEIKLIITPAKSNSPVYRKLAQTAERILGKLREIQPQSCTEQGSPDYTEELRRLHRLMEDGVITESEFEAKKKQLLGL